MPGYTPPTISEGQISKQMSTLRDRVTESAAGVFTEKALTFPKAPVLIYRVEVWLSHMGGAPSQIRTIEGYLSKVSYGSFQDIQSDGIVAFFYWEYQIDGSQIITTHHGKRKEIICFDPPIYCDQETLYAAICSFNTTAAMDYAIKIDYRTIG